MCIFFDHINCFSIIVTYLFISSFIIVMSTRINKFTFLINGISSLLGWNAVLATFDFYAAQYPEGNVYLWFPIPLFLMYVVVGLLWKEIHKRISYKLLIFIGLFVINIIMVLLPLVAYYMGNSQAGYAICLILCGMIGIFNNIAQLSFFALINFMSLDIVNIFNQGTAVSGVTMVVLRMIILAIKGPDSNSFSSILIYMILTIAVNTLDIFLNIRFFRSEAYVQDIEPKAFSKLQQQNQDENLQLPVKEEGHFKKLLNTYKEIFPYDILIYANFVQTFMLFPNIVFAKPFTMNAVWGITLLNFIFSIGDLTGRIFVGFRSFFNKQSLIYIFISRFVFFWTVIALAKNIDDPILSSDAFAFVNIFLFALTNGISTNGNFALTFETVKINKAYAGVLCGLLLQMGIFSGTLLAIPLSKAV